MGRTQHQPGRLILLLACQSPPHRHHHTPPTPPPAWELWDLGQAAAADRSSLTQRTRRTCEHWDALTPPPSAYLHWPLRRPLLLLGGGVCGGRGGSGGGWRCSNPPPGGWRKKRKGRETSREPFPASSSICLTLLEVSVHGEEVLEIVQ